MVSVERAIDRGVQRSYVSRNGGSGARLNEQWGTYLATKGFTTGILEEKMLAFFRTGTQV